ncbi:MAG: 30S ribosomal protein S24e [Methanosarcinaceae archaeon]|nr:30S ribosomal protein S24e [Methanosarcinaceae archaeon]MDD4748564.1 30S ribosomal protein S24e [Methanosarcinaceae archaeon]
MDILIRKDKNNPLLNRRELDFLVKYEGSTPSRNEVRNKLAAMFNAPFELIVIQRMQPIFGMQEAEGYAKLYAGEARMKELELEYVMQRNPVPVPAEEAEGEEGAAAE